MNNKKTLLILVLALVLVIAGASVLYNRLGSGLAPDQLTTLTQPTETAAPTEAPPPTEASTAPTAAPTETQPSTAPDFTVYDREGNPVKLSDFFGKPIVLNFWASWCGPCKMEMPDFHEKYLVLGDEVQFLMVNLTDGSRETVAGAAAFIEEQGYTFPVYFDSDSEAVITYGVYSIPTTYFIDARGVPVAQATGAIDAATLQQGIDMIS